MNYTGIFHCRYDLVQMAVGMENNTLVLKAADVGQTILKVGPLNNCKIHLFKYRALYAELE